MDYESLYEQLIRMCRPTIDEIEARRQKTCRPKMFLCHSDAAQCNLQEDIDFDQQQIIEQSIKRWAHLALTHIEYQTPISLGKFLGLYIEISEEVPLHEKEVPTLKTALLETVHLLNNSTLSFPIACKILIAGLQTTLTELENISPGRVEAKTTVLKLLHATSNISVLYTKACVKIIE